MPSSDHHPGEMLRRNSHDKFWPSRFLTIALAIWLSGMGCLFCCETPVSAETVKAESCAADDDCATAGDKAHVEDGCCPEPPEQSDSSLCQKECCKLDGPSYDLPRAPHFTQPLATLAFETGELASSHEQKRPGEEPGLFVAQPLWDEPQSKGQRQSHTFFPLITAHTILQGGLQKEREPTAFRPSRARATSGWENVGIRTKRVRLRKSLKFVNRFMFFPFF